MSNDNPLQNIKQLANQTTVTHRTLKSDKSTILNIVTRQSVALPLTIPYTSQKERQNILKMMTYDFLNEQFILQKILPCTFYELMSLNPQVHMLSIYETKEQTTYEIPPTHQFMFINFTDNEILENLGEVIADHITRVSFEQGDES